MTSLQPASTNELAEILRADEQALEPLGHGSKRRVGRAVDAVTLAKRNVTIIKGDDAADNQPLPVTNGEIAKTGTGRGSLIHRLPP